MTRAEQILPKPVEIPCWRCGHDCGAAFALIRVPAGVAAVCKTGCSPTIPKQAT